MCLVKKLFILGLTTLSLSSCGPDVGKNVYVGVRGGPSILGKVIAKKDELSVIRVCSGEVYTIHFSYLIETEETCPANE